MKENQERDTNGRFKKTRLSYNELQQKVDNQAKQIDLANEERSGIINNSNRKDREILTLKDQLFEKGREMETLQKAMAEKEDCIFENEMLIERLEGRIRVLCAALFVMLITAFFSIIF